MKTSKMLAVLITGGVLALSGPVFADERGGKGKDETKEKVEMARAAKVNIDQAIKTASEKVQGKVIEAELEKKHDKTVWEVEVVTAENQVMEVHVDADSGAVIDVEEQKPEKKQERKRERKKEHKD